MAEENFWTRPARRVLNRRRVLASAAAGGAGLALAACAAKQSTQSSAGAGGQPSAQAAETPQSGGTFVAYTAFNLPLDPQKVSAGAQRVVGGVMSRIFRFRTGLDPQVIADHDVEPDLGLSAESPDAVTWTIKLRPDAKFTNIAPVNGHAVEAEDIKATFTRALNPATSNPNRGSLDMIDPAQIQTPDKQTVVFKLTYPFAPFRQSLASPAYAWIFPREVLSGGYDPSKTVIGSGPFTLESAQPDVAYIYKKNPDYFDKAHVYVDGIRYASVPDAAQQLAQFGSGNLDELYIDNPNDLDTAQRSNPKATQLRAPDGRPFPIYFQMGEPGSPFQDVRVRRAISMAIDREALGKVIYNGQAQLTLFAPAYVGKWSAQVKDLPAETQQYYKYNPAEAKKLLDAAGATNLQLKFAYVVNGGFSTPLYVKQVEAVNNMLNAAGIKTALVQHDYNKDFVDAGKGSRQGYFDKDTMIFASTAGLTEADEFLFSYFHSKSTSNQEHLSDPALDEMLNKERTLVDTNQRLKAVLEIEKYIADKMYCVPTVGSYRFVFTQPRLRNYNYSNSLAVGTETYSKVWLKT